MKSTNSDSIDLYNQQELVFLPPPCCIKGYFNKLYYLICILWRCIQGHVPDNWTILGRNLTKIKRLIFRINMSFNKSYSNHRKKNRRSRAKKSCDTLDSLESQGYNISNLHCVLPSRLLNRSCDFFITVLSQNVPSVGYKR